MGVLPMLNHRKKVEKSLMKSDGPKSGAGEKKALLERLTSLIAHKLCKMRLSSMPLESPADLEYVSSLVSQIILEARRSGNKEHTSCCSSCLVFVLRSVLNLPDSLSAASAYVNAVTEWSTKRTQLGASLFDELIGHMPSLAQATLSSPLSKASQEARSPFLKTEAYRLLALLFATKPDLNGSELEN